MLKFLAHLEIPQTILLPDADKKFLTSFPNTIRTWNDLSIYIHMKHNLFKDLYMN